MGDTLVTFHDFNVASRDVRIVTDQVVLNEATEHTYLLDRMLQGMDLKKMMSGGRDIVDHIQGTDGGNYAPYTPGDVETPEGQDDLVETKVPFTFNRDFWVYDEEETDLNKGDKDRFINIRTARELRCLVGTLNGMEGQLTALPDNRTMEDRTKTPNVPYTLLAYLTRDGEAPSATNGGIAAGSANWTTRMKVNSTNNTWWKNSFANYQAGNLDDPDQGLINSFRQIMLRTTFEMPTALKRYGQPDQKRMNKQMILTNEDGMTTYEARLTQVNDRLVSVQDPHIMGIQFHGIPITYISKLDDLGWTAGSPDYLCVNFNHLYPIFHSNWFMNAKITDGGSQQPNRHTVWKFVTWQLFCRSLRRQGRISAA